MKNEEENFSHQNEKCNLQKNSLVDIKLKRKTCKFQNWIFLLQIEVFRGGENAWTHLVRKFKWFYWNFIYLHSSNCRAIFTECKFSMCPSIGRPHEYSALFCEVRSNNLISDNYRHMIAISSFPSPLSWTPPKPIGSIKSDRISYYFRYNFILALPLFESQWM